MFAHSICISSGWWIRTTLDQLMRLVGSPELPAVCSQDSIIFFLSIV